MCVCVLCVAVIEMCLLHIRLGLQSPHRDARLRRRGLRQQKQAEEEFLVETMKQLQAANEEKQLLLEAMEEVEFSPLSPPH